jgi:hypothetical protein
MGFIDKDLTKSTFGFHAVRWWATIKPIVEKQRQATQDNTMYEQFEKFATKMMGPNEKIDDNDRKLFIYNQILPDPPRTTQTPLYNAP